MQENYKDTCKVQQRN